MDLWKLIHVHSAHVIAGATPDLTVMLPSWPAVTGAPSSVWDGVSGLIASPARSSIGSSGWISAEAPLLLTACKGTRAIMSGSCHGSSAASSMQVYKSVWQHLRCLLSRQATAFAERP